MNARIYYLNSRRNAESTLWLVLSGPTYWKDSGRLGRLLGITLTEMLYQSELIDQLNPLFGERKTKERRKLKNIGKVWSWAESKLVNGVSVTSQSASWITSDHYLEEEIRRSHARTHFDKEFKVATMRERSGLEAETIAHLTLLEIFMEGRMVLFHVAEVRQHHLDEFCQEMESFCASTNIGPWTMVHADHGNIAEDKQLEMRPVLRISTKLQRSMRLDQSERTNPKLVLYIRGR